MKEKTTAPITISIRDFSDLTQLGRTTAYKLIAQGKLKKVKVLGRTLVTMASVQELLAAVETREAS